jgi:hypothetical protein
MSPICHFRTGVCRGCGDRRQHRGAQQLDGTYSETCLVGLTGKEYGTIANAESTLLLFAFLVDF